MGLLNFFLKRQEDNNKDVNGSAANINRLGMTILSDEKFLSRIGVYDQMLNLVKDVNARDDPQTLKDIEDLVHKFNSILHQVAIPFGRAGDSYYYSMAMGGWSTLHTIMMDMIDAAKSMHMKSKMSKPGFLQKLKDGINEMLHVPTISENEMDQKVLFFFTIVYLRYALLLAEISWYTEDVRPSWSTVIQQPIPVAQPKGQTSFQQPRDLNQETGTTAGGDKNG